MRLAGQGILETGADRWSCQTGSSDPGHRMSILCHSCVRVLKEPSQDISEAACVACSKVNRIIYVTLWGMQLWASRLTRHLLSSPSPISRHSVSLCARLQEHTKKARPFLSKKMCDCLLG